MNASLSNWIERLLNGDQALEQRQGRLRKVANDLILHLHPTTVPAATLRWTYTWGLGGISAALVLVLFLTGIFLMFRYDASTANAYTSIQVLESQVMFGSLVRALHHWSANLLVITAVLHLLRVLFTGAFKGQRTINWLIGLGLLILVLAFNFTGYLLPWDQLAFWAITVSTSLLSYIPLAGEWLSDLLLGGSQVGQNTLRTFYAIHVAVLPGVALLGMFYHFWKIRKAGGLSQPPQQDESSSPRLSTFPHLIEREFSMLVILVLGLLIFSMFVAAPLEDLANPNHSPNPAKAAWYFLGLQELLLHMHPLAAVILIASVLGLLVALPWIDRRTETTGVYFGTHGGRNAAIAGAFLSINLLPLLVIADEYWINLTAWLPDWPVWVTSGAIPLAASLLGLFLILILLQAGLRIRPAEALLGLISFLFTGLVVLTVIGVFFRGPNMALVLPF